MLKQALELAAAGFHIFPIKEGEKAPPLIKDFPNAATRDTAQIVRWWTGWPRANVGISTSRFGDDEALVVVDIDVKGKANGFNTLSGLDLLGYECPAEATSDTPSGGRHLFFRNNIPVRQGANVLGEALDIRSLGGYVLGGGSTTSVGEYRYHPGGIAQCPAWILAKCGTDVGRVPTARVRSSELSPPAKAVDIALCIQRLKNTPAAYSGGRNHAGYAAACCVRDFGVLEADAEALLEEHWACDPPLSGSELAHVVSSAYRYAKDGPGNRVVPFTPVPAGGDEHPFAVLNGKHAYVKRGDMILWETTDAHGRAVNEYLAPGGFHRGYAAWTMAMGKKQEPVTELWMRSALRRSYDGLCFFPERPTPENFFNLWKGFAFDAAPTGDHPAVTTFLEHAYENVCAKDRALFNWLMSWFAHLVQKPWEKPLVALVFKGAKGVGKNALIERIGALLGRHFLLSSDRRYLVGNFNGYLENLLLFALDEAFWSGDKQAEGTLKGLITGKEHNIEHKGKETYTVDNLSRVVIIGNESWIVPASHDERRFAVFDVGDKRKQDLPYFQAMREGMEQGGYPCLLRYLLDYRICADVNEPPRSAGLLEQKHASLELFGEWWLACLKDGEVVASEYSGQWPGKPECRRMFTGFRQWARERNIRGRLPSEIQMGKDLHTWVPTLDRKQGGKPARAWYYVLPDLETCRSDWAAHMGHTVTW